MAYDTSNVFAKMLRGEIPCIKVYEDAHALAFLDINPASKGHTLVIPKVEAQDLFDLPASSAGPFLLATQKVARAVKEAVGAPGIHVSQHNGAAAGQSVFHVHFHIIPRWPAADGMRTSSAPIHGTRANDAELEALAEIIRAKIK